jgi:SAM-dependent methyltransferase
MLPFQGLDFDLIVSGATFQWYENWEASIGATLSLLKPGGVLLFSQFISPTMELMRRCAARIGRDQSFLGMMSHHQVQERLAGLSHGQVLSRVELVERTRYFTTIQGVRSYLKDLGVGGSGCPERPWSRREYKAWSAHMEEGREPQGLPLEFSAGIYLLRKT